MKISQIGTNLIDLIPNTQFLYLDNNLIYKWEQFFDITQQLRFLHTLALTNNRMRWIDQDFLKDKDVNRLINQSLKVLVLIGVNIDWSQIDILTPVLAPYIEELHLCRNKCSKISSKYEIDAKAWKNLKYLNLEENDIEDWDEIQGFRNCPIMKNLGLNKNKINEIKFRPGFREVYVLSLDDNLIDQWSSIDQLNEYNNIKRLRISNNPLLTNCEGGEKEARAMIIARMKYISRYRGGDINKIEKKDCELFYMKKTYQEFIKNVGKVDELDSPKLIEYMSIYHPRWYELVEMFGNPIEELNSIKIKAKDIKSNSFKIVILSHLEASKGKKLKKKVLASMTVQTLKTLCSKLFKADSLSFKLSFKQADEEQEYELDDVFKELNFFCIYEDAVVHARPI